LSENQVAEVEMLVCDDSPAEAPSIVTLLPKERTYNVASIVDKSALIGGGGIVGGLMSVGVSFLWGHKTYYIVQQQDTVAIERDPSGWPDHSGCGRGNAVAFAWQFRPVLGQKIVRTGQRQLFVQLAYQDTADMPSRIPPVFVRTTWRTIDPKKGTIGAAVGEPKLPTLKPLQNADTRTLTLQAVRLKDVGQGNLLVEGFGDFLPGMRIRIGGVC
jgi:hypothetical protein